MFIDTHAHIYSSEFEADIEGVIERALHAGIEAIVMPSIDKSHFNSMTLLSETYPSFLKPLIGIHPCSISQNFEEEFELFEKELHTGKYCGIGEIGIDLYWDKSHIHQQKEAFRKQLQFAIIKNLPVVIHQRDSFTEILQIIEHPDFDNLKGIFHCYAGDIETAIKLTERGFYLGIGGVVTYKNSLMAEVVKHIPLKHLVLETDSPYLPPVPFRGKRNEPAHIQFIAQKIAELKLLDIDEVAQTTTLNAKNIFKI
jgi:TatD DNase family protein